MQMASGANELRVYVTFRLGDEHAETPVRADAYAY
jgi:hypothetical protein